MNNVNKVLAVIVFVFGTIGSLLIGTTFGENTHNGFIGFVLFLIVFIMNAISAALIYSVGTIIELLNELRSSMSALNSRIESTRDSIVHQSSYTSDTPITSQKTALPSFPQAEASSESLHMDASEFDKGYFISELDKFDNVLELNNFVVEVINQNPDLFSEDLKQDLEKSLHIAKMYGNAGGGESYKKKILDYLNNVQ